MLTALCFLRIVRKGRTSIFADLGAPRPTDNSVLDALTQAHIEMIETLLQTVNDVELRARLSDVAWTRIRKPEFARIAVEAYIASAARLVDAKHWPPCSERFRRAAEIAARLGRNGPYMQQVIAAVEQTLASVDATDPSYLGHSCMQILLDFGAGDASKYAELAGAIAERAGNELPADRAERLWLQQADWYRMTKDVVAERGARMRAAEAWVRQASVHAGGGKDGYAFAVECINRAIGHYRRIPNSRERTQELHQLLLEYQHKAAAEMRILAGGEVDLSESIAQIRKEVSGKPFAEAIVILAGTRLLSPVATIRKEAEDQRSEHPLLFLFKTQLLDSEGRKVAVSGQRRASKPDTADIGLLDHMCKTTVEFSYRPLAQGVIIPAVLEMAQSNEIWLEEWLRIAHRSQLVPHGRELQWATALDAGFNLDCITMLHVLVPQLEHALRVLLKQRGIITTNLGEDGIQEERDLGWILDNPTLRTVVGDDYVFHLRCLLVERFGANLRNMAAHGLITDGGCHDPVVFMLWWLALRLVLQASPVSKDAESGLSREDEAPSSES